MIFKEKGGMWTLCLLRWHYGDFFETYLEKVNPTTAPAHTDSTQRLSSEDRLQTQHLFSNSRASLPLTPQSSFPNPVPHASPPSLSSLPSLLTSTAIKVILLCPRSRNLSGCFFTQEWSLSPHLRSHVFPHSLPPTHCVFLSPQVLLNFWLLIYFITKFYWNVYHRRQ